MPSGLNPQPPGVDQRGSIQSQCPNRGASSRRQACDRQPIFEPGEVFEPILQTRVEKADGDAGLRINGSDSIPFEKIASPTGQAEVIFGGRASQRLGNDMVNRELGAYDVL